MKTPARFGRRSGCRCTMLAHSFPAVTVASAWPLRCGVRMSHVMPPTAGATPVGPAVTASVRTEAVQRVVKVRRDYNSWVARETMEDYALRFTPHSFRKWSELRVANTAFGAASFLVLEAVGATLLVQYGFLNAFWAILATGLIIFLAGLPISLYA